MAEAKRPPSTAVRPPLSVRRRSLFSSSQVLQRFSMFLSPLLLLLACSASPARAEGTYDARWEKSTAIRKVYDILCKAGIRENCCRIEPAIVDAVNAAYAPAVAYPPPRNAPPLKTQPEESLESRLDCSAQQFEHLFTGRRLAKARLVLDAFLFSHELEVLQVRMLEHGDAVDYFVIGENNYTLRGTYKPYFTRMAPQRFASLGQKMVRLSLSDCDGMQDALEFRRNNPQLRVNYRMEVRSKRCMLSKLEEQLPGLPDDTLIVFGDADELSRGIDLYHLKHCELKDGTLPLQIRRMSYAAATVHRLDKPCSLSSWQPLPGNGFSSMAMSLGQARREGTLAYRTHYESDTKRRGRPPPYMVSGVHLSGIGALPAVEFKLMNHGEGGGLVTFIFRKTDYCDADIEIYRKKAALHHERPAAISRYYEIMTLADIEKFPSFPNTPPRSVLESCHVLWPVLDNPEYFPSFFLKDDPELWLSL